MFYLTPEAPKDQYSALDRRWSQFPLIQCSESVQVFNQLDEEHSG